jgi:hypothetical protein
MRGAACALAAWLLALGCGDSADPRAPRDVVAEVSDDISTVVNVRWATDEASIGYVEYGVTEEMEQNTPLSAEESEEHAVRLLGLKADTVYHYRVVTWDGRDAAASDIRTIRTGDLPTGMPRLRVTGDGHDQFTVVPVLGMTTAVLILDPEGDIVWYHRDDRELDFYRARLSLDGESLLYNAASVSGDPSEDSELVRVALDGSESTSIPVPLLAHDFVEHEDGTLAAMVVEYREFEGPWEGEGEMPSELRGDKIVEITPDGEQTTVWSAWDCFDPAEWTGDNIEMGWTFANALDYDPAEDAYYLGMRNFSSIVKIDRATGECEWVLGLYASTFDFAPGSERFLHQHQFHVRGNRIVVMDNDGMSGELDVSRVLEYELDFDANLATQVWSYTADPTVYTFVLGEPTRFDDGSTFINWSTAGQLERVSETGESLWKLNSSAGIAFGFHTQAESLYPKDAERP